MALYRESVISTPISRPPGVSLSICLVQMLTASCSLPPPPRVLEGLLQDQGRAHQQEVQEVRRELLGVKEESGRQQQLLAQSLLLPKEAQVEACLQHEITRLANENLVGGPQRLPSDL